MRAVVVDHPGDPDVLRLAEVPDPPPPGPGEVLLDVVATAVNRADLLQREGHYPPPHGAPPYLGLECSGVVREVGPDVVDRALGEEVVALLGGGGYAERVLVPAGQVMPRPAGVEPVYAAALPEVSCTVWSNLFMLAGLRPGDLLLVHGGASGIGTMAIQLGRAAGARVVVTVGSREKARRCRELGADVTVDYREEDFVARVREESDGHGADVVLDNMGAAYLTRNLDVLAPNGRLCVIGMQGGRQAEIDLNAMLRKRVALLATSLRARPPEEKAAICASVVEHVWPYVASGTVRPVVDRVLPLAEAAEAHRVVEASLHVGKVVLAVAT